ncbi:hypothetical protein F5B20DRAFT_552817 [Whalleya microplaca]|nr:hypothetical protein F5B20DRAFT_552817 [Whalleya microplaca]
MIEEVVYHNSFFLASTTYCSYVLNACCTKDGLSNTWATMYAMNGATPCLGLMIPPFIKEIMFK